MKRRTSLEELQRRVDIAFNLLSNCKICPRQCGVNRLKGERGYCRSGRELVVSSYSPHFGEEPPLVGSYGSGTIFFTHCSLRCIYCQNYEISLLGEGTPTSETDLATMMLSLQKRGCHNINLVTPTHFVPQILASLVIAFLKGLNIPVVYNCGGYESVETLKLLEGIVDIYMPDFKYGREEVADKFSHAPDYPEVAKKALREMHRQVGDLVIERGIAQRGLLIRHLVLPHNLASSSEVLRFIAREISPHSYVNIMAQYRPEYKAREYPELNRRITGEEYEQALKIASQEGLYRGFVQNC